MRTIKLIISSSLLALMLVGCGPVVPELTTEGPALGDVVSSGCKAGDTVKRSLIDGNPIEAIAYETSATIIHHDAMYQCNADIMFEMTVNGEELTLREVDKSVEVTRCMCPVDLSITLNNLTPGKTYHVMIYDEFETKMFGEVWITIGNCEQTCQSDSDCFQYSDMPRLDCPGNWACIEGLCNYYCDEVPVGCKSDVECPDGFQCVYYDYATTDPTKPEGARMMAMQCTADQDCPEGNVCEYTTDCACPPDVPCDCMPYGYCTGVTQPWPVEGVCEPIVINNECWSDVDCGSGYHCEFYYPTPGTDAGSPDANGDGAAEMPPIDCFCTEEWAPVCGFDNVTYSNACFAKCSYVEVAYDGECQGQKQAGVCVQDQNPGCLSDADCQPGYRCELTDWCAGTDPDGDGMIDTSWCMGQCVYSEEPVSCEQFGGFCAPYSPDGQMVCPDGTEWLYGNAYGPLCGAEDMICCVRSEMECASSEDCYAIYGDYPADPATGVMGMWECIDGRCQATGECGKYACYTDSDCGDGYACVSTETWTENGVVCTSTQCVQVDPYYCDSDASCPAGLVCMNGVCTTVEEECRRDDSGMCVCGGFAGFACPVNNECIYDDPNCSPDMGGADCMGHCYPTPDQCVCDMMYAPVCGSDNQTYGNACAANCAGVEVMYEGECQINCPPMAQPECAAGERMVCETDAAGCPWCKCVAP